jgi:hypothetical protein
MNAAPQWFFRLVENSGQSPAERLVAVFGVVENLLQAPDIRERLKQEFPGKAHCLYQAGELSDFLGNLADAAGMANSAGIAQQLSILLQGAIAEELRNPGSGALGEAAIVARVVIDKSTKGARLEIGSRAGWASVGGVVALLLAVTLNLIPTAPTTTPQALPAVRSSMVQVAHPMPAGVSPDEIEAVLALHEKIERGICRAPHLLVLPPGQVTAYMNAIEARTPEDPAADGRNLRAFLAWFDTIKSTECYDPPLNGHTSVKWSKS